MRITSSSYEINKPAKSHSAQQVAAMAAAKPKEHSK